MLVIILQNQKLLILCFFIVP